MEDISSVFSLKDKNILVTGASSGIGRQVAVNCSKVGARIIAVGRDDERLRETLSMMSGKNHIIMLVDLTDYEETEKKLKEALTLNGKLDGVVNCAGISTTLPFLSVKPDKMELFFKTNVIGAFNLTRVAVKKCNFSERGGSVIFISSVMGLVGEIGKSLYGVTKGATDAGVKSLSIELAHKKIRVNAILPGVVETPMSEKSRYSLNEESLSKIKALHPLGLGTPDDIANACIYLLSDASRWVTGTEFLIDGGYTAR